MDAWRKVAAATGLVAVVVALVGAHKLERSHTRSGTGAEQSYPKIVRPTPPPPLSEKLRRDTPIVYGHRGSWAYRPEHTEAGYRLAVDAGVDYLESDVVSTKDGVLIVRHDNELSIASDVEDRPEFRDRYTTKQVEGVELKGWFSEDFTLDEIKELRAEESQAYLRPGSAAYDGRFEILTVDELLKLVRSESRRSGREIGLLIEPKYPRHFRELGLPLEEKLAAQLEGSGLTSDPARVVVESFNLGSMQRLDAVLPQTVGFALLVNAKNAAKLTDDLLRQIPDFVDAILFHKGGFAGRDDFPGWVRTMQEAGFAVIIWPLSFENKVLPEPFRRGSDSRGVGDLQAEVDLYLETGADGFLADAPTAVIEAVEASTVG